MRPPGAARNRLILVLAAVQLCTTDSGGHSWPGGTKPRGTATPTTALRATDLMWDFFTSLG